MSTGYTRQANANIQPSLVINAEDLNAEFNQLQSAFNNSTGHSHDGTVGGGAPLNGTSQIVSSGSYGMSIGDGYIFVDTTVKVQTITLPASPPNAAFKTYTIKDYKGNAAQFNITISGGGVNIDGTSTVIINRNYGSYTFAYNGSTWSII